MTEIVITITQFLWRICYLIPAVMLIVLNRKKKASVRTFFKGMALSFLLYLLLYVAFSYAVSAGETFLQMAAAALGTSLIGFVLFYCVYNKDDTFDTARSRILGVSQLSLLLWGFVCIYGLEIWHTDPYVIITDDDVWMPIKFMILAIVKTVIILLGIFVIHKLYSSEKSSGRKKVILSSLITTFICFPELIFEYVIAAVVHLIS